MLVIHLWQSGCWQIAEERQAEAAKAAAQATSNRYVVSLAELKATAEDTREALSDTIDFEQLGVNYSAAIAASDAYYAAQIAGAEAALAKEEENSEAYHQIEADLFNLRREQVQARERLTQQAAAVGEAEAQNGSQQRKPKTRHSRKQARRPPAL